MKRVVVLGCCLFFGCGVSLRAGSIVTIADGSEATGKITFTSTGIHVDTGSSPIDVNYPDVLAANFGDTPLQIEAFYGNGAGNKQLPDTWKQEDIGTVGTPGSVTVAAGTYTLHGSGATPKPNQTGTSDNLFFIGRPWAGDGEWTARVKEIDTSTPDTSAGLMLRDTLDAGSPLFLLEAAAQGNGLFAIRPDIDKPLQAGGTPMDIPVWLRVTRYGTTFYASTSTDGLVWDVIWQNILKTSANTWIGFFADSHKDKILGNAIIDQVAFTPAPSTAQVYPSGVLLESGTFLAGSFNSLDFHPANITTTPSFNLDGKPLDISLSKIAAVTLLPTTRSQLADVGSKVGLLMKNGDFMDGPPDAINGASVRASSIALGTTTYNESQVRACVLAPLQQPTASYEIRLRNGSIIYATAVNGSETAAVIQEVSGLTLNFTPDQIGEFRAGPAQAQSLAELNWKVIPPAASAQAPAPQPGATSSGTPLASSPSAPAANVSADASAVPDQLQPVHCWGGNNGEQIIMAPMQTAINFPLSGRFRALAMRVAVSPDSPPNSSLAIRVLADGREVATTPELKVGDQPRFLLVPIQNPRVVTLEAGSNFAGARVLFLDPVVIRDKE